MTTKRHYYCETCGNMFIIERAGIEITHKCPNCTRQADNISVTEYKKLLKQKELI